MCAQAGAGRGSRAIKECGAAGQRSPAPVTRVLHGFQQVGRETEW